MRSDISLERLKLNRRLGRYRSYADEALRQAAQSHDPEVRHSCLNMAAQWNSLANEIESAAKDFDGPIHEAGAALLAKAR